MTSELEAHGEPAAYFTFPSLAALGVPHATTTRHCPGIASFAEPIVPEAPRAPFRADATSTLGGAGLDLARAHRGRDARSVGCQRGAPARGRSGARVHRQPPTLRGVPPGAPVLVSQGQSRPPRHARGDPLAPRLSAPRGPEAPARISLQP